MKKFFSLIIIVLLICPINVDGTESLNIDDFTLKPRYQFCKDFGRLNEIESIEFSRLVPESYDSTWDASISEKGKIIGYRKGNKAIIVGDHIFLNPNSSYMFAKNSGSGMGLLSNLVNIDGLDLLDSSRCTNMSMMFYNDDFLTNVKDLENWDTSSVKTMELMFSGCTKLKTVSLENWNVSNVVDFSAMFQGLSSNSGDMNLTEAYINGWDVSSAEDMGHMFYGCSKLKTLDLRNWDISHVKTFTHTFADCYGLEDIDLSGWNTESVESFDAMFNDCRSLQRMDLTSFKTGACEQFSQMFESCYSLEHIDGIELWDMSNASEYAFSEMFHGCRNLKDLDLSRWVAPHPDNTFRMFKGCGSLTELDLSGINMATVESSEEMFDGCSALIK